ncbi:hypothetical protein QQP08_006562 [Theobroma cacao]|nr:hypothetical protein QQP08_006562 [Theobroma cacao]
MTNHLAALHQIGENTPERPKFCSTFTGSEKYTLADKGWSRIPTAILTDRDQAEGWIFLHIQRYTSKSRIIGSGKWEWH